MRQFATSTVQLLWKLYRVPNKQPPPLIVISGTQVRPGILGLQHLFLHSPSVSVALLITLFSLVFRLVEVVPVLPRLSMRPVPSDTTHSRGVSGHKHLHSWTASAVGLLISRPPSCAQKHERIHVNGLSLAFEILKTEGDTFFLLFFFMAQKQIQVNRSAVTVVLANAPPPPLVPVGLALISNKCPRGPSYRIHSQPRAVCVCREGVGGGGRGCGLRWIGMRLPGPRGWALAAGSNAQGPLLIKEARLGVGSTGAPQPPLYCGCVCAHVWWKACVCSESMRVIMRVHVTGSVCHMASHTQWASGSREEATGL